MTTSDTVHKLYRGGCLCGAIRYEAQGPDDRFPHLCSCEHCQKRSGGPVMAWTGFPVATFAWTGPGGEPRWFETFPGQTKRGFCGTCGSHIAAIDPGAQFMGVTIPSLDEPHQPEFAPIHQSFSPNAAPYCPAIPSQLEQEAASV